MVATRNNSLEPVVDAYVQSWVSQQITDGMNRVRDELTITIQESIAAALGGSSLENIRRTGEGTSRGNQPQFTRMTKLEFPKFGGEDVRGWLYKCEQFFEIDHVADHHKVQLASLHLVDTASLWHRQFDPMGDIKNLRHTSTIEEYQNAFDKLLSSTDLPKDQQISFYITGLQNEVQLAVKMFRPKSLTEAYHLSKIQETQIKESKQRYKLPMLPTPKFLTNHQVHNPQSSTVVKQLVGPNTPLVAKIAFNTPYPKRQLSQKEFQDRRAKNLCFYCDQNEFVTNEEDIQEEVIGEVIEYTPQISLHALNGVESFQTMRVTGHMGKHQLHILIDCGSTRNILDLEKVKQLGCHMSSTCPLQVDIQGRAKLVSMFRCKKFVWQIHRQEFVIDAMILPLGGSDMVLGIQWLSTLGSIKFDFKALKMKFQHNGKRVTLRGTKKPVLQWMEESQVPRQTAQLSSMVLCVYPSTSLNMISVATTAGTPTPPSISNVFYDYEDVFAIPTALPPMRAFNHKIVLKEGT
ncbi:retrotransposable element Tf2 [Tanacetum coccineum]